MTPETTTQIREWVRNEDAVQFLVTLFDILHCVDDVTDGDKPVTVQDLHTAFFNALITLPRNAFYQSNFAMLNATLQTAILNWHAANRMEVTEAANAKEVAYVLRSSYNDLITCCAGIISGYAWAQKVAYECRLWASKEGFGLYLIKLKDETRPTTLKGE